MTILNAALTREKTFFTGALKVGAMTTLLCFSSFIKVPLFFTPVPVTLQTFVVFLAAGLLSPLQAFSAVAAYIGIGVVGAPFFANAGWGIPYVLGPTGGYLLGFAAAAWLSSALRLTLGLRTVPRIFLAMATAVLVIYMCGGLWLLIGYRLTLRQVLYLGVAPFVLPDLLKAWSAAWICARMGKR